MNVRSTTFLTAAFSLAVAMLVAAQAPITKSNQVVVSATIQAIDSGAKTVTLRDDKGNEDTFSANAIERFNELKVGQKVKVTYYESIVFMVLKPGEKASATSIDAAFSRAKGALPGGTIAAQAKTSVTVKSVDPQVPSITVTTEDGRQVTRKVEDKKHLDNVKPGDRIDITYTQAVLAAVEPAK